MKEVERLVKSVLGEGARPFAYTVAGAAHQGWRLYVPREDAGSPDPAFELVEASWRVLHAEDIRLFEGPSVFRTGPDEYSNSIRIDPKSYDPSVRVPSYSQVFALPQFDVLDIVAFCEVGSHNARRAPSTAADFLNFMREREHLMTAEQREMMQMVEQDPGRIDRLGMNQPHGDEPWKQVHRALAEVMRLAPFAIQSADAASLRATFLNSVSAKDATRIGEIIGEVNPEAVELAINDLSELGVPVPMDTEHPDMPDFHGVIGAYIRASGRVRMWWD